MPGTMCTPSTTTLVPSVTARCTRADTPTVTISTCFDETHQMRVQATSHRDPHGAAGVERRVVDLRHEGFREERPHDLADGVGGDDPHDSQTVGQLAGQGALPHPRRASDEDDDRPFPQARMAPFLVSLEIAVAFHLAENPANHRVEFVHRDPKCALFGQEPFHFLGHSIGPVGREPCRGERLSQQAFREGHGVTLAHDLDWDVGATSPMLLRLLHRVQSAPWLGLRAGGTSRPMPHHGPVQLRGARCRRTPPALPYGWPLRPPHRSPPL